MKNKVSIVTKNKAMTSNVTIMRYPCNGCHKTFTRKGGLKAHVARIHGPVRAQPPQETVLVQSRPSGQKMICNEDTPRRYACFVCPKKFPRNMVLRQHMREHTGENHYYSCVVCMRKFFTRSGLEQHMGEHTGVQNVYTYVPPWNISHNTEGPTDKMQCTWCTKTFIRECSFRDHMTQHSEDEPLMFTG